MSLLTNLDSVLCCPICNNAYDSKERIPISLKCSHIHCKRCSQQLHVRNQIRCTICRKVTDIENIDELKKDFELVFKEVLEVYNSQLENQKTQLEMQNNTETTSTEQNYSKIKNELGKIGDLNNLLKFINDKRESWKNVPIRIAFIGKAKVGKSTLINTLRGLAKKISNNDQANDKEIALTDVVQCTRVVKGFVFNGNKKILLCDLPGVGTPECKQDNYLKLVDFSSYDYFVLLTNDGFFETDNWLLNQIIISKKPFAFVYSKIDATIEGHLMQFDDYQDLDREEINFQRTLKMDLIRTTCKNNIENLIGNEKSYNLFLISCLKSKTNLYDYKDFNYSLFTHLPKLKRKIMSLAIKPLSDKMILEKSSTLLHRIEKWKGKYKVIQFININIQNIFKNYFREFVLKELEFYKKVFDLKTDFLKSRGLEEVKKLLEKYDNIDLFIDSLLIDPMNASEISENLVSINIVTGSKSNGQQIEPIALNNSSEQTNTADLNKNVKDFNNCIKGIKKASISEQAYFIQKTCEFLQLAVEDMQAACLMIMSSEINLIHAENFQ